MRDGFTWEGKSFFFYMLTRCRGGRGDTKMRRRCQNPIGYWFYNNDTFNPLTGQSESRRKREKGLLWLAPFFVPIGALKTNALNPVQNLLTLNPCPYLGIGKTPTSNACNFWTVWATGLRFWLSAFHEMANEMKAFSQRAICPPDIETWREIKRGRYGEISRISTRVKGR